jgi:hypothetical protein
MVNPLRPHIYRWSGSLLVGILLSPLHCFATSVVAFRTAEEIVIAADSRATASNDLSIHISTCKIRQMNSVFVASAGFMFSPATGFSIEQLLSTSFKPNVSIRQGVRSFERAVIKPMLNQMIWERKRDIGIFRREYEGKETLQIVFATIENSVPVLLFRSFKSETVNGKLTFHLARKIDCPGDCTGDVRYVPLGEGEAIAAYMEQNPRSWFRGTFVETAKFFVSLEIEDKPEFVASPIDVLRLTKDGAEWIQKKQDCANRDPSGHREKRKEPSRAAGKSGGYEQQEWIDVSLIFLVGTFRSALAPQTCIGAPFNVKA